MLGSAFRIHWHSLSNSQHIIFIWFIEMFIFFKRKQKNNIMRSFTWSNSELAEFWPCNRLQSLIKYSFLEFPMVLDTHLDIIFLWGLACLKITNFIVVYFSQITYLYLLIIHLLRNTWTKKFNSLIDYIINSLIDYIIVLGLGPSSYLHFPIIKLIKLYLPPSNL